MIAEILMYMAIGLLVCVAAAWTFDQMVKFFDQPSAEEIAAREARRIAKQATKEFKRRKRLGTVRFWNF